MSLNSGLCSKLLRKTAIKTAFYFPAEEDSVHIKKINASLNTRAINS